MDVKLKDVAEKAKVSVTTVSLVLNGKGDHVSEATKKRILDTVKEMHYVPRQKVRNIGLMLPDLGNLYYVEVTRWISLIAQERHYNIYIFDSNSSPQRELQNLHALLRSNVEGIIMGINSTDKESLSQMRTIVHDITAEKKIPIVLLDRMDTSLGCHSIVINNFQGGYLATKHLVDLGHRKIGCITGNDLLLECQERTNGYRAALHEAGIDIPPDWIVKGSFTMETGYESIQQLLDQNVTAVFAQNDMIAFGINQYLKEQGLSIPQDLSLVGFDNLPLISMLDLGLTTISQPIQLMCERAFDTLLSSSQMREGGDRISVTLAPDLIVRSSTAALT